MARYFIIAIRGPNIRIIEVLAARSHIFPRLPTLLQTFLANHRLRLVLLFAVNSLEAARETERKKGRWAD